MVGREARFTFNADIDKFLSKLNQAKGKLTELGVSGETSGQKVTANYLLMDFPIQYGGSNNYSPTHIEATGNLLNPEVFSIKLSESTNPYEFTSPSEEIYSEIRRRLEEKGFKVKRYRMMGKDIEGACGQLYHHNNPTK